MSEALISQVSGLSLRQDSYSEEEDDQLERKGETVESWLRRHLLALIACEESAIDTLLLDISPIFNLITCEEKLKTVFVTIQRTKRKEIHVLESLPTVHFDLEKLERRTGRNDRSKQRKHQRTKIKGKEGKKRSKSRSNSRSPAKKKQVLKAKKKVEEKDLEAKEKEKAIAEDVARAQLEREILLSLPQPPETLLSWHLDRSIPSCDQFVFVVSKPVVLFFIVENYEQGFQVESRGSLDETFHIGYVNNNRFLKGAFSAASKLFENRLGYEMNLDILLAFYGVEERKMDSNRLVENFILDYIIRYFCVESRARLDTAESRSVQALLQPVLQKYCMNIEQHNRNCLLIQLSFYDIDLLDEDTEIHSCARRLERAIKALRVLNFLYSENVVEWSRRMFLLLMDIFSTILARHITRKCDLLIDFDKSKIQAVCSAFSNSVDSLRELSQILFDSVEDRAPIEKLVFSFNVVTVLEEEVDETLQKVEELHCEKWDIAIERGGIREAQGILKQLNEYLEENCMESAVESSNLESLRTLARNLSSYQKRLDGVVAMLPNHS